MPNRRGHWLGAIVGLVTVAAPALVLAQTPQPLSEKVGERLARGIVDESLETLAAPENQARLGRIVNSPQMRVALHDLTASIVVGVFDGLTRVGDEIGKTDVAKSIGDGMDEHIAPAMSKLTHRLVASALSASLADEHVARMQKATEGTTHAAVRGAAKGLQEDLGPALAATLDQHLGPAIARMYERDIFPAAGRGLNSPDMQAALAHTTSSIANGLVHGTDEALDETDVTETEAGESRLGVLGGTMALGYAIALGIAFAFGTALVVLTVVLVRNARRQREESAEARRREQALLRLVETMESDHPGLAADSRRQLLAQMHDST